jgi:tripartite-type tricarboxylate transporter receptor subunit TctC
MPTVPTFHEQGFSNFTAGNWLGLMGPAALPDALAQRIFSSVLALGSNAVYQETLLGQGIDGRTLPAVELGRLIRTEYDRNKALFSSLGMLVSK